MTKIHHAAIDGVSGAELAAAIHDLESHGLRPMLISAVVTATERSRDLARGDS